MAAFESQKKSARNLVLSPTSRLLLASSWPMAT